MADLQFGTREHLIAWIGTKATDEAFQASAGCNCLFCQYGEANGIGPANDVATYAKTVTQVNLSDTEREIIVGGERTFGLALERALSL